MAKTAPKNFRTALDEKLARELLNVAPKPSVSPEGAENGQVARPLGERLKWAVEHLASVVKEANAYLEDSELSRHLAEALCARKSRRGFPYIHVDTGGQIMLEVSYDGKQQIRSKKKRKYKRELPLLEDLRKEAAQLGISVSHLGQKRRAIYDYLQEIQSRHAGVSEEDTDAQMAAGHDEVTVTEPKDGPKLPRKRRQIKLVTPGAQPPAESTEPEAKPSPNLTRLMEQSADLDIEEILSDNET